MTKTEFDSLRESDCPCGEGQITRHIQSTDYRYTSVHVSYSIDCKKCSSLWRIDHGTLVLRNSEIAYLSAKAEGDSARKSLYEASQEIVKRYCAGITIKSKKAELEHLKAIGICEATYDSYLKGRRNKEMYEMAYGPRNLPWLMSVAAMYGQADSLSALLRANECATLKSETAYKQIVRRALKQAGQSQA